MKYDNHVIQDNVSLRFALEKLNTLAKDLTLFIVNENGKLVGTLTDGDIRRALIKGSSIDVMVSEVMFKNFRYLSFENIKPADIENFKKLNIRLIPVLDSELHIRQIINLDIQKTILPLDAIIMAGGRGERLRPMTDETPKPLLKIGDKPIIEYNIDRLLSFGINNIAITLKYLGEQIEAYFGNGESKGANIKYFTETDALGTFGAVTLIDDHHYDHVLIMNSDLLTNIDFSDIYNHFLAENADMVVASIPYDVSIPYAVLHCSEHKIENIKEKPVYTYFSNAGIYIVKREMLRYVPVNKKFDATDFIELLIDKNYKVVHFPIREYWLDIGKPEDFIKAQSDIKHLKF